MSPIHIVLYSTIIIVVVFGLLDSAHIKNQLVSWKLLSQPEHLTELYFTSPNTLPTTYTPTIPEHFAFTTHNLEYKTIKYGYKVFVTNADNQILDTSSTGSFVLQQGQYRNTPVTVSLADLNQRVKVVVELTNTNESIDYWVNEE
jgi:hypothetical protein